MPKLTIRPGERGGKTEVLVHGDWTFASLAAHESELERTVHSFRATGRTDIAWNLAGLTELDDVGALWPVGKAGDAGMSAVPPQFDIILAQEQRALAVAHRQRLTPDLLYPFVLLGKAGLHMLDHLRSGIGLLGQFVLDIAHTIRRPREFPLREISANIFRSGVTALPVTMLVGFLVGVVLTYLSALQLKSYGADLLVIAIVSVGVARELGPMLASIIAAGRSGSTMTAQLGVMRVTEEIEALQVMGISVTERLVLPKLIGLALAMPLVSFATDVAALADGKGGAGHTIWRLSRGPAARP